MRFLTWLLGLALVAGAASTSAARLDTTPDTLIARANRLRDAQERRWDPDAGYLGNLRHVQIVAPDCVVRVTSGPENRLIAGHASVSVTAKSTVLNPGRPGKPTPRDVVLTGRGLRAAMLRACALRCRWRPRTNSCSAGTG